MSNPVTPEVFWSRVDRSDPVACWPYPGKSIAGDGYKRLNFNLTAQLAHRVAYQIAVGPIPGWAIVRHKCDNPPCVNPAHLELGTYSDNNYDCSERGRYNYEARFPDGKAKNKYTTKLSDEQRSDIRRLYETDEYSMRQLGRMFGVSHNVIRETIRGVSAFGRPR